MHREPWLHFWGLTEPSSRKAVIECLNVAGIPVRAFDSNAVSGDGILCTSRADEEICEFLRELTQNCRRVLVLQPPMAVVDNSVAWRLLHSGASDVLEWSSV